MLLPSIIIFNLSATLLCRPLSNLWLYITESREHINEVLWQLNFTFLTYDYIYSLYCLQTLRFKLILNNSIAYINLCNFQLNSQKNSIIIVQNYKNWLFKSIKLIFNLNLTIFNISLYTKFQFLKSLFGQTSWETKNRLKWRSPPFGNGLINTYYIWIHTQ